jgi:hypothetical protein
MIDKVLTSLNHRLHTMASAKKSFFLFQFFAILRTMRLDAGNGLPRSGPVFLTWHEWQASRWDASHWDN